jgi:hypothetical protein
MKRLTLFALILAMTPASAQWGSGNGAVAPTAKNARYEWLKRADTPDESYLYRGGVQ